MVPVYIHHTWSLTCLPLYSRPRTCQLCLGLAVWLRAGLHLSLYLTFPIYDIYSNSTDSRGLL